MPLQTPVSAGPIIVTLTYKLQSQLAMAASSSWRPNSGERCYRVCWCWLCSYIPQSIMTTCNIMYRTQRCGFGWSHPPQAGIVLHNFWNRFSISSNGCRGHSSKVGVDSPLPPSQIREIVNIFGLEFGWIERKDSRSRCSHAVRTV